MKVSFFCLRILALAISLSNTDLFAAKLTISCGANGIELDLCKTGVQAWAQKSGHQVEVIATPNDSNERLALYQQLLAAKSSDVDVFQIDVVWPGILEKHLVDLSSKISSVEKAVFFQSAIANNTVQGKLVTLPWFMDSGLLYYRKDLLEKYGLKVPNTWEELGHVAATIQKKESLNELWGYVFQGRAYEGLTCNAIEWIASYGGGTVIDHSGKVTINNPAAAKALNLVASWMGSVVPQGVLSYGEEESRGVFQSGKAVFMRNWPYAWALLNSKDSAVKNKVGVARLPKGDPTSKVSGTLGGWGLAVSEYSKNKDSSIELVKYLTSHTEQKRRALTASFHPTIPALYDDKEVISKNPFIKDLKNSFQFAISRPASQSKGKYSRVSTEFWSGVHEVLSTKHDAVAVLSKMDKKINSIIR